VLQRNSPLPPLSSIGEPWWDDKPLAIVGTGPSLKGFDFSRFNITGVRVLAVKEAIWDLPFAECVFSLDRPWINRQADLLRALAVPKVFAVEPEYGPCAEIEGALYIMRSRFAGFSDDPAVIQSGGNSGFGAVNYAYLKKAKRIALFGFDYTDKGGEHYCPERYHWYAPGQNARYWHNWGDNFIDCKAQLKAAGIAVMNASPISTVVAFEKCSIEDGLKWLTAFG
jgi:hypothetical protein